MKLDPAQQILIQGFNQTRPLQALGTFCHAPAVNLNFDQNGNATACCFNRLYKLGTYPKNSLKEIWNGPKARKLRKALEENDLSSGCYMCEYQLKAKNFQGLHARDYDQYGVISRMSGKYGAKPVVVEFEISNVCNLECVMCNGFFSSSIRKNREKLEPMHNPYDEEFRKQFRSFIPFLSAAKFLGGEPFLNPLYYKIWEDIIEINPAVNTVITTNGTILNDKTKDLIRRLRPAITFSCDSFDRETYLSIRKGADYDQMRKNMEFFIEVTAEAAKGMSISICPMKQNWRGIPEIFQFCNNRGICLGANTVVWPPEVSMRYLPQNEVYEIYHYLKAALTEEVLRRTEWWIKINCGVYQGMLSQILFWAEHAEVQVAPPEVKS